MSDPWYALQVKSSFEKYVTTQLESKGFETFLPNYVSERKWPDRIRTESKPKSKTLLAAGQRMKK